MQLQVDTQRLKTDIMSRAPSWVRDVTFRETVDSEGAPVLLTFLLVAPQDESLKDADKLWDAREVVAGVFEASGINLWPHVRFEYQET